MQIRKRYDSFWRKYNCLITVREGANVERMILKTAMRYLFLLSKWPKFE